MSENKLIAYGFVGVQSPNTGSFHFNNSGLCVTTSLSEFERPIYERVLDFIERGKELLKRLPTHQGDWNLNNKVEAFRVRCQLEDSVNYSFTPLMEVTQLIDKLSFAKWHNN